LRSPSWGFLLRIYVLSFDFTGGVPVIFWQIRRRARSALAFLAAKIRCIGVLARIDDAPADGAGSGEIIMQHLTIASSNRPLQREELFGEAPEDL
jgi:hypothetical protein